MCSILGYSSESVDLQKVKECFEKTKYRGPDDTRVLELPGATLMFHRLAIMGLNEAVMQPFHLQESAVVCNGEIYCFRPVKERLKKKYEFISESDCEILLP